VQQNLLVWQPDITGIEAASNFVRIMGKMPWATHVVLLCSSSPSMWAWKYVEQWNKA